MNISIQPESGFSGAGDRVSEALSGIRSGRVFLLLAVVLTIIFLGNTVYLDLTCGDETRVAGISREMQIEDNYLLPQLNDSPFLEYPPLYYYLQVFTFDLFGVNSFAAKLPSALAAMAGAMLLFALMRMMRYRVSTAFLSALILATGAQYFEHGLTSMVDSLLVMFCTMAWLGFYGLFHGERRGTRISCFFVLAAGLSGATMTKNLPGLAIFLCGAGIFLLADDFFLTRKFRLNRYFILLGAVLLSLLPLAVYTGHLHAAYGLEAVRELIWDNNFGRFLGSQPDHAAPVYEYLLMTGEAFQPWMPFLLLALIFHCRKLKREGSLTSLYGLCILMTPFFLLSLASGKRMVYLLPLAAPAALLTGSMLGAFLEGATGKLPAGIRDRIFQLGFWLFIGAGIAVPLVFLPVGLALNGLAGTGRYWAAAAMMILMSYLFLCRKQRKPVQILMVFTLLFALIYANVSGVILSWRDRRDSSEHVYAALRQEAEKENSPIYLDRPRERDSGGAVFYLGATVPETNLKDAETRRNFPEGATVLMSYARWKSLQPLLPPEEWTLLPCCSSDYMILRRKKPAARIIS